MPELDLRDLHARHEPDPAFRADLRRRVEAVVAGGASTTTTAIDRSEEEPIMLTDTRTEVPEPKRRPQRWFLVAAAAVILVLVGVVAVTTSSNDDHEAPAASSAVVFHDDFSDDTGDWEMLPDHVRVEDGRQVWTISTAGQVEFLKPRPGATELVDVEVTAAVASADPDSTVGVYCRKGLGNQDAYYYFRMAPRGVTIGVLPPNTTQPAEVLAQDASVPRPSGPFTLTARCADEAGAARLTLLVDGEVALEAMHDEPLQAGVGALEVQAGGPGSAASEVRFDEFTVAALGEG